MAFAKRVAIVAFRNDPLREVLAVVGYDLTDAQLRFCVRQYPDQQGDPLLEIFNDQLDPDPVVSTSTGMRLVEVTEDADGVKTSVVEVIAVKSDMQLLPPGGERGEDLTLYHDLDWILGEDEAAPFAAVEETVLYGDFILKGSAND